MQDVHDCASGERYLALTSLGLLLYCVELDARGRANYERGFSPFLVRELSAHSKLTAADTGRFLCVAGYAREDLTPTA